jgi:hypothetical protein
VNALKQLEALALRNHKCNYSQVCATRDVPAGQCDCGAEQHNAAVKSLVEQLEKAVDELMKPPVWTEGYPPKPWADEEFIAVTKHGRVVLRALPDDYAYDFATADDTYIKKENILKWMQFPDTEFKIVESRTSIDCDQLMVAIDKLEGLRLAEWKPHPLTTKGIIETHEKYLASCIAELRTLARNGGHAQPPEAQ